MAALIRRGGAVLMSQRRADQPMPLLWEFPGGKVEAGEDPVHALAREIREELGCAIRVGRIEEVVFHPYPTFDLVMLVYECTLAGEHEEARAIAVERVVWIPRAELPTLELLPADYPLARRLAAEPE